MIQQNEKQKFNYEIVIIVNSKNTHNTRFVLIGLKIRLRLSYYMYMYYLIFGRWLSVEVLLLRFKYYNLLQLYNIYNNNSNLY